jgi:outer membrane receptor protein involved in Fe transport
MSKISEQPNRSSNNFVYSGSVAFAPCSLITWKTGGEFYRNQIEDGHYKNMFMLDTKLTLNLNTRIELSVSATNLLNNKEYSYTSYGTVLQYERSSALRGREFMISLHFKK